MARVIGKGQGMQGPGTVVRSSNINSLLCDTIILKQ